MLLGAAQKSSEVLQIDVAAYISYLVPEYDANDQGGVIPVELLLAVTSPTRGAVEQLQSGNVRVYDARVEPDTEVINGRVPVAISFDNLGGGFYRVEMAPSWEWAWDQYALRIEVVCPWGRGITVHEIPIGASDMNTS